MIDAPIIIDHWESQVNYFLQELTEVGVKIIHGFNLPLDKLLPKSK